ncbi:MAG: hypothetical protein ACUVSW_06630 [Roseiflexus sp.]
MSDAQIRLPTVYRLSAGEPGNSPFEFVEIDVASRCPNPNAVSRARAAPACANLPGRAPAAQRRKYHGRAPPLPAPTVAALRPTPPGTLPPISGLLRP